MIFEMPGIRYGFDIENRSTSRPWVQQVHGNTILALQTKEPSAPSPKADGLWTFQAQIPIYVFTADCVPLLFFGETARSPIAAIHSGWRGTNLGIVSEALRILLPLESTLHVAIGPAIRGCCYEVKEDLVQSFENNGHDPSPFLEQRNNKLFFDHPAFILHTLLSNFPPTQLHTEALQCTYCSPKLFPSYRRNGHTDPHLKNWIEKTT